MTGTAIVPAHWDGGNIRRFAQMKSGHTPSRSVAEYWENTDIPWFTLADVWQLRDGKQVYLGETANKINELGLANSAAELLPAGTVVLSRTASVGFSGVMPRPMATSQDFWNWVCGSELLPEYLNYQFKSMINELKSLNMGSTHQTIYQKDAAGLQVVVPPMEQQRAIVAYLDRETAHIDPLIDEQQRLIVMLRERRTSAIAGVLESLGGMTKLKYVSTVQTGITLSGDGDSADPEWPYLRVANVQIGHLDLKKVKTVHLPPERAAVAILQSGDVLMTEGGDIDKLGRGALWRGEVPNMLHQNHIFAVRPSEVLDSQFLVDWLDGPVARTYFRTTAKQTTNLAGTNKWTLGNLPVPVPPLGEQRRLSEALREQTAKIDALIGVTEKFIELAHERRAALIIAAVTGQFDVREMG